MSPVILQKLHEGNDVNATLYKCHDVASTLMYKRHVSIGRNENGAKNLFSSFIYNLSVKT